jgi:hypothetical protein
MTEQTYTGISATQEALRVRSRLPGYLGRLSRDVDFSLDALEKWALGHGGQPPMPVLQTIAKDLWGANAYLDDAGMLRRVDPPTLTFGTARPPPFDPAKARFYHKPPADGLPKLYPAKANVAKPVKAGWAAE